MIINLSKIDFGGVATGGGKTKPEEVFDVQPTTSDQTITPSEGSVFSGGTVRAVTSEIDVNIVSDNIKEGVTILGVAGSHKGAKPEEVFDVQPTTSDQTITPTEGSVFSGGTVRAVTSEIDNNIVPENIKEGVSILGVAGTLSEGSGVFVVPDGTKFRGSSFTEISQLDTSNMTDMSQMFYECSNLQTAPQMDTSNVTNTAGMFYKCSSLTSIPQLDISNVTDTSSMFVGCSSLVNIPRLDTSKTTTMSNMFYQCSSLTSIPQMVTSSVTNMYATFYGCSSLATIPLLDTSNVTTMWQTFQGCTSLTSIPLFNTQKVEDMTNTFFNCSKLTSIPQLDTSSVISMYGTFRGCSSLTTIPLIDTSNVKNMLGMFYGCNLTTIPQLDTSSVTDMSSMFENCPNLITIPQLNTSNVTNMGSMFGSCPKLATVPRLDTSKVTKMNNMFEFGNDLSTVEGIDFSGLTSGPSFLFGYNTDKPTVTRFIVNGKINVSFSDNYSIKALTAIDYDSVKSILAAADRTDNTNKKTLAFNRTMTDQNGELTALVTSCTSKGWTISGLTIN